MARRGRVSVLSAATGADERVSAAHRAKLAYVYVRQSSVNQVRQHQESTELQYRLVDRAVGLGWPRERVRVIDEDLGKSGAASAERHGFQRLKLPRFRGRFRGWRTVGLFASPVRSKWVSDTPGRNAAGWDCRSLR